MNDLNEIPILKSHIVNLVADPVIAKGLKSKNNNETLGHSGIQVGNFTQII
jgi:hypothetical protein